MIRASFLAAAIAVGLSFPASAESNSGVAIDNLFTEVQARQHLLHLGYTDVSTMTKDSNGKWVGTATTKDGKVRAVAVDLRGPAKPSTTFTH